MLGEITAVDEIYIVCGYTDMSRSIDGLCAIVEHQLHMDPRKVLFLTKKRYCILQYPFPKPFCLCSVSLILTATDKEALAEYPRAPPAALISCCFLFLHSLVFSADEKFPHNLGANRNNSFRPHTGQFFPLPLKQCH